eukprot:symbB.v1.2.012372.t1/scaffold839.1/size158637/11
MADGSSVPGPISRLASSLRVSASALAWSAALHSLQEGQQAGLKTCTSKLYGLAVKATKSGVENWPRCLQLLFSVPSAGVQLFNQVANRLEVQWALSLEVLEQALQRGHWSVVSSNCAIRTAMHAGWQLATAMLVQQEKRRQTDLISWNSAMAACARESEAEKVLVLLQELQICRQQAGLVSFNTALDACAEARIWTAALQLLDTVRNASMESDNFTLSSLTVAAEWRSPDIARGITQCRRLLAEMGWDDDDDWEDEDNIEAKLEANRLAKEKAQKRLETGEDESSEEEEEEKKEAPKPKKSTWEDSEEEEEEKPKTAPKAKAEASDDEDEWEDWDDDETKIEEKLKAQMKEKEKQRKREAGEDTESEEEKETKKEEKPKPAPKKKGPTQKAEEEKAKTDPSQVPLADPKAERERLKKLEEDRDARLGMDLFAGFEKKESLLEKEKREKAEQAAKKAAAKPKTTVIDEFDNLELKLSSDVDSLCAKCLNKFETSTLNKGGPQRFLSNLIKNLESTFETADLDNLEKSLAQLVKDKKVTKANATLSKDNKAATKINKNTKFNKDSEWADVYGDEYDDEDWTQEEWDDWNKQQAKKK